MDALTQQIVELLNQGKSYRDIQKILSISSKKIAQVRKEFSDLITSANHNTPIGSESESAFRKESGSASTFPGGIKTEEFEAFLANYLKNSPEKNIDAETLKALKKMHTEHEQVMRKMEYEERERERAFIRENKDRELKEKKEAEEDEITIKELRKENWELKNQLTQSHEAPKPENRENTVYEPDDSEYWDDMRTFVAEMLKLDKKELNRQKIEDILENISELKDRFQDICDADGTDVEDFTDWKILTTIETGLEEIVENIKKKKFTSAELKFIPKTREMLVDFLD